MSGRTNMETDDGINRADMIVIGFMGEMLRAKSLEALVDIETRSLTWCETHRIERDGRRGFLSHLHEIKIKAALDMALINPAMPAAAAVTLGRPVVAAVAAAPAVVAAVWNALLKPPASKAPPAWVPLVMTFWMMTGAATVLKMIQNAATARPIRFCNV